MNSRKTERLNKLNEQMLKHAVCVCVCVTLVKSVRQIWYGNAPAILIKSTSHQVSRSLSFIGTRMFYGHMNTAQRTHTYKKKKKEGKTSMYRSHSYSYTNHNVNVYDVCVCVLCVDVCDSISSLSHRRIYNFPHYFFETKTLYE